MISIACAWHEYHDGAPNGGDEVGESYVGDGGELVVAGVQVLHQVQGPVFTEWSRVDGAL